MLLLQMLLVGEFLVFEPYKNDLKRFQYNQKGKTKIHPHQYPLIRTKIKEQQEQGEKLLNSKKEDLRHLLLVLLPPNLPLNRFIIKASSEEQQPKEAKPLDSAINLGL